MILPNTVWQPFLCSFCSFRWLYKILLRAILEDDSDTSRSIKYNVIASIIGIGCNFSMDTKFFICTNKRWEISHSCNYGLCLLPKVLKGNITMSIYISVIQYMFFLGGRWIIDFRSSVAEWLASRTCYRRIAC